MIRVTKSILKSIYSGRGKNVKKYDFGLLLVIGGSQFYTGSPALSALAAFRAGVDMVRIVAPKRAADIIASFSPNLAAFPLEGNWSLEKHLLMLIEMTESAKLASRGNTAVVIGGGMGRDQKTKEIILEYLSKIDVPAVIDADAIYALANNPKIYRGKPFLFTPHGYEFFILTGKKIIGKNDKEKIKIVKSEAKRLETTILLKGSKDIISNGEKVALNETGSPYMTKGGCGDTLAGICGALLAQKVDPFTAGQIGAYINGKAGELAARKEKEGLLATSLINNIPIVLH